MKTEGARLMKKRLALLLCAVLLGGLLALPVSAAKTVGFSVSSIPTTASSVIKAGEEFDITVSLGAVDALSAVEAKLRYDKTLITPVSATKQGFLNACVMADVNIAPVNPDTSDPDRYGEIWITGLAQDDCAIAAVETIATIRFRAVKDIRQQADIVFYQAPMAIKGDGTPYSVMTVDGGVTYAKAEAGEQPTLTAPTTVSSETASANGEPTSTTATTIVTTTETTVTASTVQAPLSDDGNDERSVTASAAGFAIPKWMHTIGAIVLIVCGAGLLFTGVVIVIIAAIINSKRKKR